MGRHHLAIVVAASVLSGLVEAALLALIAQTAVLIASSSVDYELSVGLGLTVAQPSVGPLLAVAAALAVLKLGLQVVLARLSARIVSDAQAGSRKRVLHAFVLAAWPAKAALREGALQELLTTQVDRAAQSAFFRAMSLTAGFNFAVLVLVALLISPVAAGAAGVAAVGMFFLLRPLSGRSRDLAAAYVSAHGAFAEEVSELGALAQELEVFGVSEELLRREELSIDGLSQSYFPTVYMSTLVPGAYQGLALLAAVAGLALVSTLEQANVAALGAVVLLILRALAHGQQFQSAHQQLRQHEPFVATIQQTQERLVASHAAGAGPEVPSVGDVAFLNVSFSYGGATPALVDVDAAITRGEAIGVIGHSGAGKSTLVQILLRLREPTAGVFQVAGRPASDWDLGSWWKRIALVPQEPRLLTSTVRENIRFLRSWVTDADVERAAKHAHIHDEILSWSDGYDTIVSNRVEAVSGGQRQRLCIARALAGSPQLLVLDEPTSVLDGQSEALIQESLSELKGQVTMVIVAHRLSTLALCDRIMVLNAGRLEAFDTAAVLEQTNPFFREAVRLARVGVDGVLPP